MNIIKHKNMWIGLCFIILIPLLFVSLFIFNNTSGQTKKNVKVKADNVIFYEDSTNKMTLEQSKYFKMINIHCPSLKEGDIKEDSSSITIYLNNGKSISKVIDPSVIISKKSEMYSIKLVKSYKDNYIIRDNIKNGELIVLLSKMEKPFIHKVVLDPGHGGYDVGGNIPNMKEKDITLTIAKEMKNEFIYNGFEIVMTREVDEIPRHAKNAKQDTRARAEIANETGADVFISIHTNYFKESKYKGIATYYYAPAGYQKEQREDLAKCIVSQLTKEDGWKNRGIFKDDLAVLRYTRMPSVLIEYGFLSNPSDVANLSDPKVIKNLCKNTVKGVMDYYNQ